MQVIWMEFVATYRNRDFESITFTVIVEPFDGRHISFQVGSNR